MSRVIVQLIDTASNAYIWSEIYDREIADVLAVQEGIAQAVVAKLELTLGLPEPKAITFATAHRKAST
jgi:adenylate cyclase